jgi:uncharacterized protein with ParB-like and HNH nuclease domain
MNAGASPLLSIFEPKQRLEVPLFQRQYVWDREHQWEPLWEDIARKFGESLEGRTDSPVHFLGAMVLDQKLTPTTHVVRRQVIDGQQRLTTLQLFLAAFRDFCSDNGCSELAQECKSYTMNSGMMADAKIDKFKVWPTTQDRPQFIDVMESGSRAEVERRHPLVRRKYQRRPDPRPRMIEAYIFFYDRLADFFIGDEEIPPLAADTSLALRLEECFNALRNALHVVIIDLGEKDDPQVIFETLNARGQPLLPADLLRNYIFLRAARLGEDQESLYERYWSGFDDDFWRKEVRQGRLNRPRSDLFMQHFLASRLSTDISAKHLYVEYKHWIEKHQPFASIESELATLERQREDFRRVIMPKETDILQPFAVFLETFEVSTVIPALLSLLDQGTPEDELSRISTHIESYVLRRAVCAMTTKNYNRIFLSLNRNLRGGEMSAEALGRHLLSLKGESSIWPSDEAFREGWRTTNLYQVMNSSRIALVMRRISNSLLTSKTERIEITSPLSVEHIMPQAWIEHWPLPNGSRGLTWEELWEPERDGETVEQTRYRDSLIHTAGNLTILSQPLNSSVSNSEWPAKRDAILESSLLPINLSLVKEESWDEEAIKRRSNSLFNMAATLWPRPSQ